MPVWMWSVPCSLQGTVSVGEWQHIGPDVPRWFRYTLHVHVGIVALESSRRVHGKIRNIACWVR